MKHIITKAILFTTFLMVASITVSKAQPAGPGDGTDPFATPVNGGVAFVAAIAFLYGVYRVYQLTKKNTTRNID